MAGPGVTFKSPSKVMVTEPTTMLSPGKAAYYSLSKLLIRTDQIRII